MRVQLIAPGWSADARVGAVKPILASAAACRGATPDPDRK